MGQATVSTPLPPPSPNPTTLDLSNNPSVVELHARLARSENTMIRYAKTDVLFRTLPKNTQLAEIHHFMLDQFATNLDPHLIGCQSLNLYGQEVEVLQEQVAALTHHLSYSHIHPHGETPPKLEEKFLRLEQTLDRISRFHYFKLTDDSKVAFVPE